MTTEAVPSHAGRAAVTDRSAAPSDRRSRSSRAAPLAKSDRAFAISAVAVVFVEHLLFGTTQDHLILAAAMVHLGLALAMMSIGRYRRRLASIPLAAIGVPFGALLLIGLVATLPFLNDLANGYWQLSPGVPGAVSVDPFASRLGLVQLAGYGALFVVGVMLAADDNRGKRLVLTVMIAALAFSVWAFVDHLADPRLVFGTERQMVGRLGAAFGSANTAATLFGAFVALAVTQLMRGADRGGDRIAVLSAQAVPILLLLFAGTCLFLTASRGGVLATALGLTAAIGGSLWLRRQRQGSLRVTAKVAVPVAVLVVLVLLLVSGEQLLVRSESLDADRVAREQLNAIFWAKVLEAPLLGHGIGSFWSVASTAIKTSNAELLFNVRSAHNSYLQWLLQVGSLGMLALVMSFTALTWRLVRGLILRSRGRTEILSTLAVLLVYAAHAWGDFSLEVPSLAAFFALFLGIGTSTAVPSTHRR